MAKTIKGADKRQVRQARKADRAFRQVRRERGCFVVTQPERLSA